MFERSIYSSHGSEDRARIPTSMPVQVRRATYNLEEGETSDMQVKGWRNERRGMLSKCRSVFIIYVRDCIYSPKSTIGSTILLSYLPPT